MNYPIDPLIGTYTTRCSDTGYVLEVHALGRESPLFTEGYTSMVTMAGASLGFQRLCGTR